MTEYDLVVIGAGPAGLSAAAQAAELGLDVLLLDEQPEPGGQIYRRVRSAGPQVSALLGSDYTAGLALVERLAASGAHTCFGAFVFDVTAQREVCFRAGGTLHQVRARQVVVATGAMERASPFPGWTLPGVMTAGAAQIALKSDAMMPSGRVALAGAGPLLLLVAQQLLRAGAQVVAVLETAGPGNARAALGGLPGALRRPGDLLKGMRMLQGIRSSQVPRLTGVTELRALGNGRLQAVQFAHRGKQQRLEIDTLLVHHGVVPNQQLTRLLGLDHRWNEQQLAWEIPGDAFGRTSRPGVSVAGDGLNIAGAQAAALRGTLAALGAAHALGALDDRQLEARAAPSRRALAHHLAIRPFLDRLYRPPRWIEQPPDETTVCRCEGVSAGTVREMAALGCAGPNQAKFFSRCGMGPCQGRVCGLPVTQLMAERLDLPPGQVGAYQVRPPLKPLPLSLLAGFDPESSSTSSP